LKKAYNLSELATGVYFIKLTAKGETLVQKLLKN
jgi:hypothetical protein